MQVRKLEEETGLILVNRQSKPVQLTGDGEPFYEMALDILHRMDALRDLPFHLSGKVEGTLRMGMIPTLAPYLLSLVSDTLEKQYPGLLLEVEEMLTEPLIQKVRTGHLDAGLIATPVNVKNLKMRPLFYERFYIYMSDAHPLFHKEKIAVGELDLKEIWYLREGNCFTNQISAICSLAGQNPAGGNLKYFSNSIESLRRIVERTRGITFLPELATMQVPSEMEEMIKPIGGTDPVREISLVHASGIAKQRLLDAFTEVVLSQLPSHMKRSPEGWVVDTEISVN
jgi:LysR family hydrogen peroxide-inducible transcriptional activator